MLTTDKPQNLNEITGVEDLSNENAAAVSGGAIIITTSGNFGGSRAIVSGNVGQVRADLGSFNNAVSSIAIPPNQVWAFWTSKNRQGSRQVYGAGIHSVGGSFNNNFESLERLR